MLRSERRIFSSIWSPNRSKRYFPMNFRILKGKNFSMYLSVCYIMFLRSSHRYYNLSSFFSTRSSSYVNSIFVVLSNLSSSILCSANFILVTISLDLPLISSVSIVLTSYFVTIYVVILSISAIFFLNDAVALSDLC